VYRGKQFAGLLVSGWISQQRVTGGVLDIGVASVIGYVFNALPASH